MNRTDVALAALREVGVPAELLPDEAWRATWDSDPRDHHRAWNLARLAQGDEPWEFGKWCRFHRRWWHRNLDEGGPAWLDKWGCP